MKQSYLPQLSFRREQKKKQIGSLSIELVLVIPILLTIIFAIVQYSMILFTSQSISASTFVGVRQAVLPSATKQNVIDAVQQSLAGRKYAKDIKVKIFINGKQIQKHQLLKHAAPGDAITVSVSVPTEKVAPKLFYLFAKIFYGQEIISSFLMYKQ